MPESLEALNMDTAHKRIENTIRLTTCFECLICQSCCPRYLPEADGFPGPLGLLIFAQMRENPAQKPIDETLTAKLTASCLRCGKCVKYCPASRNPLDFALKLLKCEPRQSIRVLAGGEKGIYVQEVPNE